MCRFQKVEMDRSCNIPIFAFQFHFAECKDSLAGLQGSSCKRKKAEVQCPWTPPYSIEQLHFYLLYQLNSMYNYI